jgi:UMF1 family MFS transporter
VQARLADDPPAAPVRGREIFGWAMFDFANSSYTTIVVTVAYSVFFTSLVAPPGRGDALWGLGVLIANGLVVLSSPVVGAFADQTGRKKALLAATWLSCVLGTAALALVGPGDVALGISLFVLSNVGFSLGENLIAAFLPEIARSEQMGRVSGLGWGLGYLGGLASLFAVRPLLAGGFVAENLPRLQLAWMLTAVFFFLAALPTFAFLRERAPRGRVESVAALFGGAFGRLRTTARSLRSFSELGRFLLAFFVFSCGLTSVIAFAGIYAVTTLGFTSGELIGLFLALQLSASGGALLFGWIQDRLGAVRTLGWVLGLWIAVVVATASVPSKAWFWPVALCAGLGIGSLQAAARALVGLFSPAQKNGEFFGFWGLAGKAAYAVGPAVFGLVSSASGSQRTAVAAMGVFFVMGLGLLRGVDSRRGVDQARSWREPAAAG